MERERVLVVDNGTGYVKAGYAGDAFPRATFPCVVGRPQVRHGGVEASGSAAAKDVFVGSECADNLRHLRTSYPISEGVVRDWDDMERVWEHTWTVLGAEPKESRILLTDPPQNPRSNRERMLETMFEKFGFQGAFVQVQAVLTLYSQGLLSGLVVDSGDGVTHAVPVIDGFSFPHLTKRLNVAGRHVTKHLLELLVRRGYSLSAAADVDAVRRVKEVLCYVALDYEAETKLARETTCTVESFTLPDGSVVRVGAERFAAPEALFNPSLLGLEAPGIAEMVHSCIQDSDIDNRLPLYSHIVLSGGSTMFPGIGSRLEKELRGLYLSRVLGGREAGLAKLKLRVEDPPGRKNMVFTGGAVLADIMKGADEFWVSKAEWEEDPHRALKKCGTV